MNYMLYVTGGKFSYHCNRYSTTLNWLNLEAKMRGVECVASRMFIRAELFTRRRTISRCPWLAAR